MKKLISILFFLIISQSFFAQNKIYLGINYSPSLSFPIIEGSSIHLDEKLNISYGITGICSFKDNLFLKSGIIYNQKGFTSRSNQFFGEMATNDGTRIYQSFVIPFSINYKISNFEKTTFLFSGGLK